jgi:hypothetical protein
MSIVRLENNQFTGAADSVGRHRCTNTAWFAALGMHRAVLSALGTAGVLPLCAGNGDRGHLGCEGCAVAGFFKKAAATLLPAWVCWTVAAGTLPPDWGSQGYYWNSSYNSTQALEYL